jgi:hypothetical protein
MKAAAASRSLLLDTAGEYRTPKLLDLGPFWTVLGA